MQVKGERIIVFGDSLSHHGLDSASTTWDVDLPSSRASGAPGDLLASMLLEQGAEAVQVNAKVGRSALSFLGNEPADQLLATDAAWRPSKVIVMLGTNDTGRDLAKTEAAMAIIRDAYRQMGAEVYAIGPMTYVGRGATLNVPGARVFDAMERVFGAGRIIDARPLTTDLSAARSSDGVHFTSQSAPIVAARFLPAVQNLDSLIAKMQRRPLVSVAIGFGSAMLLGLLAWSIKRRTMLAGPVEDRDMARKSYAEERQAIYDYGKRIKQAEDPRLVKALVHARDEEIQHAAILKPLTGNLDGYRVLYLVRGRRAALETDFPTHRTAGDAVRFLKRRGMTAWVEDENGTFVPVQGVMKKPSELI